MIMYVGMRADRSHSGAGAVLEHRDMYALAQGIGAHVTPVVTPGHGKRYKSLVYKASPLVTNKVLRGNGSTGAPAHPPEGGGVSGVPRPHITPKIREPLFVTVGSV